MIRSGVTLRKVEDSPDSDAMTASSPTQQGQDARSQLHTTLLNKICHGVRGSSPESDDECQSDNDDFDD